VDEREAEMARLEADLRAAAARESELEDERDLALTSCWVADLTPRGRQAIWRLHEELALMGAEEGA